MKDIKRYITEVDAMLAISKKREEASGIGRFTYDEVRAIHAVLDVAKTLNTLLDSMDRLISSEEEE